MTIAMTFSERLEALRREMKATETDFVLLSLGSDLPYFTGYRAMALERITMLVVPGDGEPVLFVPELEAPAWRRPEASRSALGMNGRIRSISSPASWQRHVTLLWRTKHGRVFCSDSSNACRPCSGTQPTHSPGVRDCGRTQRSWRRSGRQVLLPIVSPIGCVRSASQGGRNVTCLGGSGRCSSKRAMTL